MRRSFRYAGRGLAMIFKEEQSFRLQVIAAAIVLALMWILPVKNWEKAALLLVISWVLVLELINSALERVVDVLKPRLHIDVETVKNTMAATVLLASFTALAIGLIIFVPYVW